MAILAIIIIFTCWLFIDRSIRRKWNTPKRGWYKNDNKWFAVLSFIIGALYVASVFYFEQSFFFVFPYFLALINLLSGIEKYLYKKETKIHIHYFSDAAFWFIAGIAVWLLEGGTHVTALI